MSSGKRANLKGTCRAGAGNLHNKMFCHAVCLSVVLCYIVLSRVVIHGTNAVLLLYCAELCCAARYRKRCCIVLYWIVMFVLLCCAVLSVVLCCIGLESTGSRTGLYCMQTCKILPTVYCVGCTVLCTEILSRTGFDWVPCLVVT